MAKSCDPLSTETDLPLKIAVEPPLSLSPSPASLSAFTASNLSLAFSSIADSSLPQRPSSPMRFRLRHSSPPPAISISLDRSFSPPQSDLVRDEAAVPKRRTISKNPKKACTCSPTTHPGSFRCHYHRNLSNQTKNQQVSCSPTRLSLRRSAMTNSLVRMETAECDWVKRALSALVRPTLQLQQRRRVDFRTRPSRLSIMSEAR